MDTQLAYAMIYAAVEGHSRRRLVDRRFDDQHFGNFFVAFVEDGHERCVVNDRGFVFVTGDLHGTGDAIATVPSLYDVEVDTVLAKLGL